MIGERVQMRPELVEAQRGPHRRTIADNMQAVAVEVYDPSSALILDVGIADVPFFRDFPIEDRTARRNLMYGKWNVFAEDPQSLPYPLASDTAADRIKTSHQRVDVLRAHMRHA